MSDTNLPKHQEAQDAVLPAQPSPPAPPPGAGALPGAERGVLDLLGAIKARRLNPRELKTDDRRACVQHLSAENYTQPEIAQVLKCSERTIARDRKAIQEASALTPDPAFAPVMVGRLMEQVQTAIDHIRRVTRDRETPAQVKIDGEHRCYQIFSDVVQRLQSLGYLPTAATRLEADLTHHLGEVPSYEQQGEEIRRILALVPEGTPIVGELDQLQETVERAALCQQVINIENQVNKETDHDPTD